MGEASHPGPQGRRIRDSDEEVLDGLERELNLIASDDEPLVPTFATNLVPRINSTEPTTVQRIERVLKVEHSNAILAPTWPDRDSQERGWSCEHPTQ